MSPSSPARTVRQITNEAHLNLFTVEIPTRSGVQDWIFASRKKPGQAGSVGADAVVIVAVVNDEGTPRLLVTREYRAPLGRHELSLPAGLVDEGESVEAAARRELLEETGLRLTRILHISPPLASSAGLTDEAVCLVFGETEGTLSNRFQTADEDIESRLLGLDELRALLLGPGDEVISSRLYPLMIGFVAAGGFQLPALFTAKTAGTTASVRPAGLG